MRSTAMLSVLWALCLFAFGCGDDDDSGIADLAKARDLSLLPADDLSQPPDLTVPADLTAVEDLVSPPDLTGPRDMAMAQEVEVMVGPNFSLTFAPQVVNIKVGQTVRWTWASGSHNVVSGKNGADNAFCSPNDANCAQAALSNAGFVYRHKFNQAGSFSYFCAPHLGAGMTGTVNVN